MTPDQLQQRQAIVRNLRMVASGETSFNLVATPESARTLLEMLEEALFVAESLTEALDPYTKLIYAHPERLANSLIQVFDEPNPQPVPSELPQYFASDDALEHTEANDYTLKPEYDSVWIGIDSLAVYVKRNDEGVSVDIYPNHEEMNDSLAGCWATFENGAPE